MTATVICRACGAQPRAEARFCDACGARIEAPAAEYKQVTVLFADVVRSMDLAATLDAEGLREVMAGLFDHSAAIVQRYGGTVDKFTGDGIMAVFGAPTTLEDHAFRACLAALDIQKDVGATVKLRIGLNSGQVIAGEIGTGQAGYTAIGEQVGLAQRMESAAPAGAVILSESTARLVENLAVLGDPEHVYVKNVDEPVHARQLLGIGDHHSRRLTESRLVGRTWEVNAVSALLDEALAGVGCVVGVVGPPGIGKSRLVREISAAAAALGVEVLNTYCESHASDIPFHVVGRLLRTGSGVDKLEPSAARAQIRAGLPNADAEDLLFFEDLLGIRDPAVPLPDVAPDARRRRLTALLNSAALARAAPALYVVEDAHWIDEPSESMFAEFLKVIPQTPSLVLITYRPEYQGPLSRVSGGQTIGLRPLNDSQTAELTSELLGSDPSVAELAAVIGARAGGNPFFVEEMLRDATERGVVLGRLGEYTLRGDVTEINVPATLQATIGARIDRLNLTAKQTLNAAAVIGLRFDADLLGELVDNAELSTLVDSELLDQVRFTPSPEFAFRHPLIRAVAYESQLKSDRASLHRRLAEIIEAHTSADDTAALIAEHLEAAGDLRAAYAWHMRAGNWSLFRDITAAHTSWRRAQQVADQLPIEDPDQLSKRIEARTMLAGTFWRIGGTSAADVHFEELRELCTAAGDRRSLAIGLSSLVTAHAIDCHRREASRLADQLIEMLEEIADPTLTLALLTSTMAAKLETMEVVAALQNAQHMIDLAEGDIMAGSGLVFESPVALAIAWRGVARFSLGITGWKVDLREAIAVARGCSTVTLASVMWYSYMFAISHGVSLPDAEDLRFSDEALALAELSGDDLALDATRAVRGGMLLLQHSERDRAAGVRMLEETCARSRNGEFSAIALQVMEILIARENTRRGDLAAAIDSTRAIHAELSTYGLTAFRALATATLVEALLTRRRDADLQEARSAIEQLEAVPVDPGFVLHAIWLPRLRALAARADGDDSGYQTLRDEYRTLATELGFEGHIAMAEAMA